MKQKRPHARSLSFEGNGTPIRSSWPAQVGDFALRHPVNAISQIASRKRSCPSLVDRVALVPSDGCLCHPRTIARPRLLVFSSIVDRSAVCHRISPLHPIRTLARSRGSSVTGRRPLPSQQYPSPGQECPRTIKNRLGPNRSAPVFALFGCGTRRIATVSETVCHSSPVQVISLRT